MKKIRFLLVPMAMIMLVLLSATQVYADNIRVLVDGEALQFRDQVPIIVDERTLVPIRFVFETLGFEVEWDTTTQTAVITRPGDMITVTVGSNIFVTSGVEHTLDVAAEIIGGRIMVPLRFPLESVGYRLAWDGTTRTVSVYTR
ncbi:MAG: copper amine oxidase N-terminal domain-containing protein [Defluviitaleaceae bacterium]|nr:copper amine oxidase N-terminal domain-containing protein [Defluviitaleaceae bacterium]